MLLFQYYNYKGDVNIVEDLNEIEKRVANYKKTKLLSVTAVSSLSIIMAGILIYLSGDIEGNVWWMIFPILLSWGLFEGA